MTGPNPGRRLADRYLDAGALVAQEWVGQDRLDPARPSLGVLVAEALAGAERKGEQRADARYSALLDRIAATVVQRTALSVEQDRKAEQEERDGNASSSASYARWAAELRGQIDALRSILDAAEQAEVAGRVQALREERA